MGERECFLGRGSSLPGLPLPVSGALQEYGPMLAGRSHYCWVKNTVYVKLNPGGREDSIDGGSCTFSVARTVEARTETVPVSGLPPAGLGIVITRPSLVPLTGPDPLGALEVWVIPGTVDVIPSETHVMVGETTVIELGPNTKTPENDPVAVRDPLVI